MKRYSLIISILSVICGSASCAKEEMPQEDNSNGVIEVPIFLSGDYLDIHSGPLTKGEPGKAYYAFEVDTLHIVEYHEYMGGHEYVYIDTTYCHYAEGVFDNPSPSNLQITLENGHKYRIRCSIVINGEESLFVYNDCIQEPFASSVYGYGSKCRVTNAFSYDDTQTVYAYNTMNVVRVESGSATGTYKRHAMVDRYYGETETDGMTAINIKLTRRNFGLHFNLVPPTGGTLKVYQDYSTPYFEYVLDNEAAIVDEEHIYSLDLVNDFTTIHLKIKWTSDEGVTYDLRPEKFRVYNKTMTNISVDINDRIGHSESCESSVGLSWDNDSFEGANLTIR